MQIDSGVRNNYLQTKKKHPSLLLLQVCATEVDLNLFRTEIDKRDNGYNEEFGVGAEKRADPVGHRVSLWR